jgi:hypothetical protein
MRALGPAELLTLWERGARRHALDRSALLCAWARPELPAERIADLPLGSVTASLLQVREASFGDLIQCHIDCPTCGMRLDLTLSSSELRQPAADDLPTVDVQGWRVRAPCLRDLASVADDADSGRAARRLLERCASQQDGDAMALSDATLHDIEDALERLDPGADLELSLRCEACGQEASAQLDAGLLLWDEIDGRARALFGEVDILARAYGWTEGDILALGATRRAAYVAICGA